MADKRLKIVIFSLVLLVAVILLGVLIAHKSGSNIAHTQMCENPKELYFVEEGGNRNGTCYPAGSSTPCPSNMTLAASHDNKSIGLCDCDSESSPRAIVYNEADKTCHYIFRQAYCAHGEWLIIDKESKKPTCVQNPCLDERSKKGGEIVQLSDKSCAELGQRDKNCTGAQVVKFFKYKMYPACMAKELSISGIGNPKAKCPTGTYNSPLGGCQPEFDFD